MTLPYVEEEGSSDFEQPARREELSSSDEESQDQWFLQRFGGMITTIMEGHTGGPPPSVLDKMTPDLLKLVIEHDAEESKRRDSHRTQHLYVAAGLTMAGIIAFLGLCWMFLTFNQADLLKQVVTLLVGLVSGGIGGFAYGQSKKHDDD